MRIVFHDIDGCLNADANTSIPINGERLPLNQSAKLGELGRKLDASSIDHFVINTGRSIADTLNIVEDIASQKLQYVVAEHGAVYWDVVRRESFIPMGSIADKLELIRSFIDWYKETGTYILNERVGTEIPMLNKVANLTLDARNGIDTQRVYDVLQEVVRNDAPFDYNQFVFHQSEADGYVDAMSQIDKGDGIGVITTLLNPNHNSTKTVSIAIGNGLNDMPMLEAATIPVCPRNAEPEVCEYCCSQSGVVSEYEFIDATLQWLEEYA